MENQAKEISKYDINEIKDKLVKAVEDFGSKEYTFKPSEDFKPSETNKIYISFEDLYLKGLISKEVYAGVLRQYGQHFDIYVEASKKEKE